MFDHIWFSLVACTCCCMFDHLKLLFLDMSLVHSNHLDHLLIVWQKWSWLCSCHPGTCSTTDHQRQPLLHHTRKAWSTASLCLLDWPDTHLHTCNACTPWSNPLVLDVLWQICPSPLSAPPHDNSWLDPNCDSGHTESCSDNWLLKMVQIKQITEDPTVSNL